jgi:hypothetical protein
MQININQSRSHRQHKTKHFRKQSTTRGAKNIHPRKKPPNLPPPPKKKKKKTKLAKAGETKEKLTVSDNDAAKTKQEIKTTPQSTNDLENSIAFFISTKNKAYNTRLWPRNTALSMLLLLLTFAKRQASKPK